ncbi:helix-turn-helix transcriptional regulator [Paenibacillus albidus]|uniref:helix-turn-helix transcriptional regulator n=1 Tax=Paenibacillus albidus TaxID=2041023 RepID=UPI001BE5414C|nr:AraC family transcriptional regulator [Paenibacillus albidus]MBT2289987.1 helix-turn-helix transcriptional regulator [Paenibacillus albidus]
MYFVDKEYSGEATLLSAGTFITDRPWIHKERIIDSYEIISPIDSTLHIDCNNTPYAIESGEILVIPPHTLHRGIKYCEGRMKFHWLHFSAAPLQFKTEAEVIQEINDNNPDEMIILPVYTNKIDAKRFHIMFNQLLDLYQKKKRKNYLNAYLNCLLHELTSEIMDYLIQKEYNSNRLQPIQDWIRIHAFEEITLEQIAEHFKYNKNYLSRIYKKHVGIGIAEQFIKFRLKHAKELLTETDLSINEIASEVGYEDSKYFMRLFKKYESVTPTQYRKTFFYKHYNQK